MTKPLAVLVLLAATIAAQAQTPERLPPCQLLTEADVKAALGGGPWQVWQDMGSEEVCVFQASPTALVTLTLLRDPLGAEKILEVRRQLAGDGATPVDGLGAGAFLLTMSTANSLVFGKDQTVARLEVSRDASADVGILEGLARVAYARLR